MTLIQLRAFCLAANLGSFTAAARALGTSQPTVSELIRRLEDEMELPLFVRASRQLTLTAGGSELLPWAQRVVANADGADAAVRALRGLEGGVASFGVMRNAKFYLLSDLVGQFHAARPRVRLRVIGQNSFEVGEAVRSGDLEAGLIVLPVPCDGLLVEPLIRDEVLWVSSDKRSVRNPVTMEDVGEAPLILYDAHYGWSDPTRRQLFERAEAAGVRLDPMIEVENVDSALELVARGIGETLVSRSVTRHESFPDRVHAGPFADAFYETIALVRRANAPLSPGTSELVEMARSALLSVPWAVEPLK